jgi:hypothetical protein
MFKALNSFIARLDDDPNQRAGSSVGSYGFQVLRNPNPDIPIEPWFDYICGINGRPIVRLASAIFMAIDDVNGTG